MKPRIGELCSSIFYQGELKHATRRLKESVWPEYKSIKYRSLNVLDVMGTEKEKDLSFVNHKEFTEICRLLKELYEDQNMEGVNIAIPFFLQKTGRIVSKRAL